MVVGQYVRIVARLRTIDGYEYVEDSGTVTALYCGGNQFVLADRRTKSETVTGRMSGEPITVSRNTDLNPRKYERCTLVELS